MAVYVKLTRTGGDALYINPECVMSIRLVDGDRGDQLTRLELIRDRFETVRESPKECVRLLSMPDVPVQYGPATSKYEP